MSRTLALLLAAASTALAYVPLPVGGPVFRRTDFGAIQFLVNQGVAAGLTNNAGKVWITADSVPMDAINGAIGAWNAVPTTTAHFAGVLSTTLTYSTQDGKNVIMFTDDAYTQSFAGGIIATTAISGFSDGRITDTDIIFSPFYSFSTTQAPGTYDIQAVLTHELGHSLGANHTNILSATMYWTTQPQDIHERTLSADELAFVNTTYPLDGGNGYGTLSGMTTVTGAPLLGGAITAVDPTTGITVGGLSSVADGSYSLQVPPGNYFVYVEPVVNLSLYLAQGTSVFTSFQSAFAGGNTQPTLFQVDAGATVTANLNASAGVTPVKVPFIAIGGAGLTGDYHGSFSTNSVTLSSGQSVDVLFGNPLSVPPVESNLQILGAASLRPGSLRRDNANLNDGSAVYRFTLDIAPLTSNGAASLVIKSGTDIVTRSGLFNLTRPQAVNAGSYLGGPVAPGEILSFFGSQLGPLNPAGNNGFDANGLLPSSLGGIAVSFDQTPAPLFYVSNNQINLQVPYEIGTQSSTLMTVLYNGVTVAQATLSVAKSAPGIFVVTNADGSANGPGSPSPVGAVLVIYGTGSGVTTGSVRTGAAAPANSTVPATVTLGGKPVTPAYSGLTPGSVGLTQVNVIIPAGTPAGDAIPLQYSVNGSPTQTVNISVR